MNRTTKTLIGVLTCVTALVALAAFAQDRERNPERQRDDPSRRGEAGRDQRVPERQPGFPGQPGGPSFPGGPGGFGGGGFGGPGGPGGFGGGMPFARPGGPGGSAIAATGQYVYVVQGNQLFQFRADGLQLVKRVELEGPRPPVGPDGGFGPGQPPRPPRPAGAPEGGLDRGGRTGRSDAGGRSERDRDRPAAPARDQK